MSYKELQVDQLEEFLQQSNTVLLDTRDIHSFNAGHIEGAEHIDGPTMGKLIRHRKSNPAVLVYCYHGVMSRDIAQMITGFGFDNVNHLVGGWEAWANYQIKADKTSPVYHNEMTAAFT